MNRNCRGKCKKNRQHSIEAILFFVHIGSSPYKHTRALCSNVAHSTAPYAMCFCVSFLLICSFQINSNLIHSLHLSYVHISANLPKPASFQLLQHKTKAAAHNIMGRHPNTLQYQLGLRPKVVSHMLSKRESIGLKPQQTHGAWSNQLKCACVCVCVLWAPTRSNGQSSLNKNNCLEFAALAISTISYSILFFYFFHAAFLYRTLPCSVVLIPIYSLLNFPSLHSTLG